MKESALNSQDYYHNGPVRLSCPSLFRLVFSHRILLNQPKSAGFRISRTPLRVWRVGPGRANRTGAVGSTSKSRDTTNNKTGTALITCLVQSDAMPSDLGLLIEEAQPSQLLPAHTTKLKESLVLSGVSILVLSHEE